jgi:hypothetical protein
LRDASPSLPHIVLVIGRGEAIRNFLYSDTLRLLSKQARVTLLSVVHDRAFVERFQPYTERIIPLRQYGENIFVRKLRDWIWHAHYRWQWTEKAKNKWELLDERSQGSLPARVEHRAWKVAMRLLGNRPTLIALTALERQLSYHLRPTDEFNKLFAELQPNLVFNTSHLHGEAADLPMRVAYQMGFRTATFIFSWDNLTSRARIMVPYHDYLVWNQGMRNQLLALYPEISPEHAHITGTPQFDFHFKPEFRLSREELCHRLGANPNRKFILYTTGMASDFPEEIYHVQTVIRALQEKDASQRPQLIVRTYIKGNSPEMEALAQNPPPDVIFPPILWDKQWFMPQYADLALYTSLLRECAFGINAASTVSLELLMHDKPVINLGFDPPGSNLPEYYHWIRHINFDHYQPVAKSGAVMVAYNEAELDRYIDQALLSPNAQQDLRKQFINLTFGSCLDGQSGQRVADTLLELALGNHR